MEESKENEVVAQSWYVLSAKYKRELAVRDELLSRGYDAYVPLRYALLTVTGRKRRVLQPAIPEMVFVKADKQAILDYKHSSIHNSYIFFRCLRHGTYWEPIIVRDEEMESFRRMTSLREVELQYYHPEELHLSKGDQVRIMDGMFAGIVGQIVKIPHKHGKHLVVEIPGISVVVARIRPEYVQPLQQRVKSSTDVDGDVRRLTALASSLLYMEEKLTSKDCVLEAKIAEINMLRSALEKSKTFMPADRVAYLLAHYMAAFALEEDVTKYTEPLKKECFRLKSVSLLRLRACMYLGVCGGDQTALKFAEDTIASWDVEQCTENQRKLIAEYKLIRKRFF